MHAACVLGSPACSPALSGFRTNLRAARLLGDLLPVLGVPLRGFGGSFRVLGDLLRLLGVFNLSISEHFSSSRLLDRSGCGHKEQENRARSAALSAVQGKVKLTPPRFEGSCSGRRFSSFALTSLQFRASERLLYVPVFYVGNISERAHFCVGSLASLLLRCPRACVNLSVS